jgi:hypothetical protein
VSLCPPPPSSLLLPPPPCLASCYAVWLDRRWLCLSLSHSLTYSPSLCLSPSFSPPLSLSVSPPLSLSVSPPLSLSVSPPLSLSVSLSLCRQGCSGDYGTERLYSPLLYTAQGVLLQEPPAEAPVNVTVPASITGRGGE